MSIPPPERKHPTSEVYQTPLTYRRRVFETPSPAYKDGGFTPLAPTGARTLDSRTAFYYGYTLDSPGMIMNIPRVGSQYLMGFLVKNGDAFDGAKTYKAVLPKDECRLHLLWFGA